MHSSLTEPKSFLSKMIKARGRATLLSFRFMTRHKKKTSKEYLLFSTLKNHRNKKMITKAFVDKGPRNCFHFFSFPNIRKSILCSTQVFQYFFTDLDIWQICGPCCRIAHYWDLRNYDHACPETPRWRWQIDHLTAQCTWRVHEWPDYVATASGQTLSEWQ